MTIPAKHPFFAAQSLTIGPIGPVNFELEAGECLALNAPSGAGKTRLLRAMADLDPHAGECALDGRPAALFEAPDWRRLVSFLAAEPAWWADTPRAHLAPDTDAYTLLAALDLEVALLDRPLSWLSSGQRQRLAILRLLMQRPTVLLLDEPTTNLDADNVIRVERLMANYCRAEGACCIWVGHDTNQLDRVAVRRLTLDGQGRFVSCS